MQINKTPKRLLFGLLIAVVVGSLVNTFTKSAFAQPRILTRDVYCVEKTYREGELVFEGEFNTVQACDSYVQSIISFYNENPSVTQSIPDDNNTCGGQGQFACLAAGSSQSTNGGCDTGYRASEYGTCLAIGATSEQHSAFRECQAAGGSYESCETVAFGGSDFLRSSQALKVQECINTGGAGIADLCQSYVVSNPNISFSGNSLAACLTLDGDSTQSQNYSDVGCPGYSNNFVEDTYGIAATNRDFAIQFRNELAECTKRNNSSDKCLELAYNRSAQSNQSFVARTNQAAQPTEPVAVKAPQAVVTFLSPNGASSEQTKALQECSIAVAGASTVTIDDCVSAIRANPGTSLSGSQIGTCLRLGSSSLNNEKCNSLVRPPTTFVTLENQTLQDNVNSALTSLVAQPARNAQIADCVAAGASQTDCQNILVDNLTAGLSGIQLANCIRGQSTTATNCSNLQGLSDVVVPVACDVPGKCVDGRTCVRSPRDNKFENIGAACGRISPELARQITENKLTTACDPTSDQFGSDKEAGGLCCGGGRTECASGICDAANSEVGLCVDGAAVGGTSGGGGGQEIATGVSDEATTDCTKAKGLVQGTKESGFVLKCDFDGNGSYGFHQPTQFIYGKEAAGACAVLCADPTIDVEKSARERYRELQVASGPSSAASSSEPNSQASSGCEVGTFTSSFACVSWYRGACIVQSDGCFAKATAEQLSQVCPAIHQQSAYKCSEIWGRGCSVHPETGCYAEDSIVKEAKEEFADAITAGRQEIQTTSAANAFRRVFNYGNQVASSVADGFSSFWGSVLGRVSGTTSTQLPPTTDEPATNPATTTDQSSAPVDTSVDQLVLLQGGIGLGDGATKNNGEFQVENYCQTIGFADVTRDQRDWFCSNEDGQSRTLTVSDFATICQSTYVGATNIEARNLQGNYNTWRCYGNQ